MSFTDPILIGTLFKDDPILIGTLYKDDVIIFRQNVFVDKEIRRKQGRVKDVKKIKLNVVPLIYKLRWMGFPIRLLPIYFQPNLNIVFKD